MAHLRDLRPDPTNRRRHTPRNVGMVVEALQKVGAARSIVIDEDGVVLAGNGVVEAAAEAGITNVEIVEADGNTVVAVRRRGLSPEQKRALAIFDNRAAELAEWNVEQLQADAAAGLDLQPYWTEQERVKLLGTVAKGGRTDPDAVPDRRATAIVEGDLFELGAHRLLCGDATRLDVAARVLGHGDAALVFTDPPYGVNVSGKGGNAIAGDITFTAIPLMFDVLDRVLDATGWAYVCGGQSNMPLYARMFERYFRDLPRVVVWDKGRTAVLRHAGYHSCFEFIYYGFREGGGTRWFAPRDSDHADDIWRIAVEDDFGRVHPTQKPAALAARAIGNSSPEGARVFEPFAGSGSTLIACEQLGRACFAIDLDPQWVQVTLDRWEAFTGQTATKVGEALPT
jgi:DNA modification methylase